MKEYKILATDIYTNALKNLIYSKTIIAQAKL